MLDTVAGANTIFRRVDHINIADINHQAHWYFVLLGILNVGNQVLPNPLIVSSLQNLDKNAQEVQHFYGRLCSDMIAKEIVGSSTNTSLKKLRIRQGGYKWADARCIINNHGRTMLYLLFKGINLATRIGDSNLKDEIDKATLSKFFNNAKDLFDEISSN